jgi:hypothetical protein
MRDLSWTETLFASTSGALAMTFAALPRIVAFIAILLVGWFLAGLIAKGVAALLRAVDFNDLARRSGFAGFVENTGARADSAGFVAAIAKWFVRLIALVVAFDALGLPAVSEVLQRLLLWLPNLVVALVVLVIGGLAANALGSLVQGASAQAGLGSPRLLGSVARVAVWAFAVIIAVNQVGIGATLVNTLFMSVMGAMALAFGLAFGLGGRETAARLLEQWAARGQAAAPRMEEAGRIAAERARGDGGVGGPGYGGRA